MIKLKDLIKGTGYVVAGDDNVAVNGINLYNKADVNDIAVIYNLEQIKQTKADVILSMPSAIIADKIIIFCDDEIDIAMIKIAKAFVLNGFYPDYSAMPNCYEKTNESYIGHNVKMGTDTYIGPFCVINDGVTIGDNCIIENNVTIGAGTLIGNNVIIKSGARICANPFFEVMEQRITSFCGVGRTVICDDAEIGNNTVIQRGVLSDTYIGKGTKIGDLVVVGHDTVIGEHCKIVTQVGISGNVVIGDHSAVYGQSGIDNDIVIGKNVLIKGKTSVFKDVPDNSVVSGRFGRIEK